MARRNATRLLSCSATPCATSCASDSLFLTSRMFSWTCFLVSFSSWPRMRSASAPRRPITMRTRGVDVHPHAVTGALDLDLGDAGPLHALGEHLADLDVFLHVLRVLLVCEPARIP